MVLGDGINLSSDLFLYPNPRASDHGVHRALLQSPTTTFAAGKSLPVVFAHQWASQPPGGLRLQLMASAIDDRAQGEAFTSIP